LRPEGWKKNPKGGKVIDLTERIVFQDSGIYHLFHCKKEFHPLMATFMAKYLTKKIEKKSDKKVIKFRMNLQLNVTTFE
jgi:hypothetical protein